MAKKGEGGPKKVPEQKKESAYTPLNYSNTEQISVDKSIINQVIGQEHAVEIIKKASKQRRHVVLIGEPGTGKSMLGLALAELLPKEKLSDILSYPNANDENQPLIREVPAGRGRDIVARARLESKMAFKNQNIVLLIVFVILSILPYYFWSKGYYSDIIFAAMLIIMAVGFVGFMLAISVNKKANTKVLIPKIIVDNYKQKTAPFLDATGAQAGALLGDVLHDPFQSGGLGTPAHERVVAGMIHKTHKGVLFVDEILTLKPASQQELLTALQEKKYAITGQSERSAGAMVRTEAVPCDFILVMAGNLDTIKNMHPALRSRVRGYGYEVFMNETMPDTPQNRDKIAVFVAQEIKKENGKIPHFDKAAVDLIITEARKRASRKGHLTLRLRELSGLIRAAGDLAVEQASKLVTAEHVKSAKKVSRTLEQQMADKYIERRKEYEVILTGGKKVGRVNGLAVIGGVGGIVLPIEAATTRGNKESAFQATGQLGEIAKEAIINVSAMIKRIFGEEIMSEHHDVYVQFLQTHDGVEGDSASIAVATAVVSAIKGVPIKQECAMTGSLSVRGEVLPIGGVSYKIEAAIDAGIKKVLVPKSNIQDIVLAEDRLKKIEIIPVEYISEVLEQALDWKGKEGILKKIKDYHKQDVLIP